jgi:hypothetical protein
VNGEYGGEAKGRYHNQEIDDLEQIKKTNQKTVPIVSHDASPYPIGQFQV